MFAGFLVLANVQENHARWLLQHGIRTPGLITGVDANYKAAHLQVRYSAGGPPTDHILDLDGSRVGQYHVGEAVTVYYNPSDSSDFRTTGEENSANSLVFPTAVLLVLSILALALGVLMWRYARRIRRVLKSSYWMQCPFTLRQSSTGPAIYIDLLNPSASLRLPNRFGSAFPHLGAVWACGDPLRTLAIWEPVANRVFLVNAPRQKGRSKRRQV